MSNTEAGKRFHIKENRKGITKLESMKCLCISMEGKSERDAHRLLSKLSSIGFRWRSGHELWEHPCHKEILDRSCWIYLYMSSWNAAQDDARYCKDSCKEYTITLEHLEVLIEDFLYEHQS